MDKWVIDQAEAWAAKNPDHVTATALRRAPEERKIRVSAAIVALTQGLGLPRYLRGPSPVIAAHLALGVSPVELAPRLTRAEASAWADQSDERDPRAWLWERVRFDGCPKETPLWDVVRWVQGLSQARRESLVRKRDGEAAADHLLDFSSDDLRPSVTDTLVAWKQRVLREAWGGPTDEPLAKPPKWVKKLPEGVRLLNTYEDLHMEGLRQRHCVASYAKRVADGHCHILSLVAADGTRSTAEVVSGRVVQHRGSCNADPSPACVAIAKALVLA